MADTAAGGRQRALTVSQIQLLQLARIQMAVQNPQTARQAALLKAAKEQTALMVQRQIPVKITPQVLDLMQRIIQQAAAADIVREETEPPLIAKKAARALTADLQLNLTSMQQAAAVALRVLQERIKAEIITL